MRRSPSGFTLVEILFATVIMAFSLIPIFGLMTTGMMRTDTNVGYTTGVEIATGIMNQLLSEQTDLSTLPESDVASGITYPTQGDPLGTGSGNVADDTLLDGFFPAPEWATSAQGTRVLTKMGTAYHVEIWIGKFGGAGDLNFGYYDDPVLDFSQAAVDFGNRSHFDRVCTVTAAEATAGFTPYDATSTKILRNPWAQDGAPPAGSEIIQNQADLTDQIAGSYQNFAKLLVRVSWGYEGKRERGRAKEFWLISYKADLRR